MKKILGLGVAVALLTSTSAIAADLYTPAPVYAPAPAVVEAAPVAAPARAYDWSGVYAGIVGGYGWGDSNHTTNGSGLFSAEGYLLGGTIGYNLQAGNIVYGVEADVVWSDFAGTSAGFATDYDYEATLRGRVGYAFDAILPYVTGGLALVDVNGSGPGYAVSETQVGLAAGAGVEVGVTENVSVKAEYLWTGFNGDHVIGNDSAVRLESGSHAVRTGVMFSF